MNFNSILLKSRQTFKNLISKFSTKSNYSKSIQVCILGSNSLLGIHTSLLMKQNPLISTLHLQGCAPIENIGKDLNCIDTSCNIKTYYGLESNIFEEIKNVQIILILPSENFPNVTPISNRIMAEGKRLYTIATACTIYAPRSIIVVCVPPISITTAIVSEIFKRTNCYQPGKIIGSTAFAQIKANTLIARYQDLDPHACYVPIVGGPDIDLAVPLFSQAIPVEVIGENVTKKLMAQFRGVKLEDFPKILSYPNHVETCPLAESYAINTLISIIASGICGDQKACANAYLRNNALDTCKYLVNTVRFTRNGIIHNYGIPRLLKFELDLLERAAVQIKQRELMALEYLDCLESKEENNKLALFNVK